MLSRSHLGRHLVSETGGVIVMVAVWLGTLLLLASFVIDIGNWFEHKRHLQLQADAGALAGGGLFTQCFGGAGGNSAISDEVRRYSGAYSGAYNEQVGNANRGTITTRLNRLAYERGGTPDTDFVDGAPPCTAGIVDVKMTEANLPFFFGAAGSLVPAINARARVSFRLVTTRGGSLPIAAPDNNVVRAEARFVDEDNPGGPLLGSAELFQSGTSNGLIVWSSQSHTPASVVAGNARNIGVRIVLSGNTSLDCSQLLVECYDASRPEGGLAYLRGWSSSGSGAAPAPPLAREVSLFPVVGFCTSSAFYSNRIPCSAVGVRAVIDIGARSPQSVDIWAEGGDCVQGGNSRCHLEFQASQGLWETTGQTTGNPQKRHVGIAVGSDDRFPITLHWEITDGVVGVDPCTNGTNNPCKGPFVPGGAAIQRTFGGAIDLSGPIKLVSVIDPLTGVPVDNLEQSGTARELDVSVGVIPNYQNAKDINDPVVSLRVANEEGDEGDFNSRNKSIDCDPDWPKLSDEIKNGCRPQYTRNTGTPCPAQNVLWTTPQPWNCVKVETGAATGQVSQGMTARILQGGTCAQHPNNWLMYPNLPLGDTRIVSIILTAFGAFGGQGSGVVPVTGFANFYVTGWAGLGASQRRNLPECRGPGDTDDGPVPKGYILGHFINYADSWNSGGGTDPCPFLDPNYSGVGSCVAVLTH